jgi:PBP1b-binding outer membrane lipoprotein LpoB
MFNKISIKIVSLFAFIALLAVGCSSKPEQSNTNSVGPTPTQSPSNNNTTQNPTPPSNNTNSTWQGVLKTSDNSVRGNYMLILDKSLVYINTQRDYSALVGKQVNVKYSGSLENFKLEDITLK